jgi:hypothetical protein
MIPSIATREAPASWTITGEKNESAAANKSGQVSASWKLYELVAFRFFFLYFIVQAVPLDWKYYRKLFSISWNNLYYGDIFNIARYYPVFYEGPDTFRNWAVAAIIALTGTLIWSVADKKATAYNGLYYWLRVLLRYRLAVAVISYGFLKVFPLQAPFPSISNLNTAYGDLSAWKLFSLSLGAAPLYEVFLGLAELGAGLLLLYRKTASLGAFILIAFTGNVFLSNLAYEGGEHIYSLYLVVIALFLFAFDFKRLLNLLSFRKPTLPNHYTPVFGQQWQRYGRYFLKGFILFFFVGVYGYKSYAGYKTNAHHIPVAKGLPNSAGVYDVRLFSLNGKVIPYSATDPDRWKDVVFEKWATISIKSNRPVNIDSTNTEIVSPFDADKTYEFQGSAGRHYYSYTIDSAMNIITLTNRNKHYAGETLVLQYQRPDDQTILLEGRDAQRNTIKVVLNRIDKKYLFQLGRSKPIKL